MNAPFSTVCTFPLGGRLFHAISPASTATFNRRFPFPVRLFLARASAFKNLRRARRGQPAALLLPVGGAAQHGTAQLVQRPQQGRKAVLVALVLRQQRQCAVGVALRHIAAQRFWPCPVRLWPSGRSSFSVRCRCAPHTKTPAPPPPWRADARPLSGRHSLPRAPAQSCRPRTGCGSSAARWPRSSPSAGTAPPRAAPR